MRHIHTLCAILLVACTFIGAWNTIARYVGRYIGVTLTSNALLEMQWCLFSIMFLIGGGVTYFYQKHIYVDIFFNKFTPRVQRVIQVVTHLALALPFSIIAAVFTVQYFMRSWRVSELSPNPGGMPIYLIKVWMPIGFILLVKVILWRVIENMRSKNQRTYGN